jgi:hypothetical protein
MKIFLSLVIIMFTLSSYAQWTKGGSTKNYEKYSMRLDSVRKVKTTQIPVKNTSTNYFGIGILRPTSDQFNTVATPNQIFSSQGFAGGFFQTGNMGGATGFNVELGGIQQFKNKNLTTYLDLGANWEVSYSAIRWKLPSNYSSDPSFGVLYQNYLEALGGGTFHNVVTRFGLNLTINPQPQEDMVRADIFFRGGVGFVFGGAPSNLSVYSYETFTTYNGNETWDGTVEHKDEDVMDIQFPLQFGVNLRIMEKGYIGFRYNFFMIYDSERSETRTWEYQYNDYDTPYYSYGNPTFTDSYNANVDLKNFTVNVGLLFK